MGLVVESGSVGAIWVEASTAGGTVASLGFEDAAGDVAVERRDSGGEELRESSRTVLKTKSMF